MNNNDMIIIGGGLGGLTTGALLAKEGWQVTVLEKNHIVGGGLQNFSRHGIHFDTGMHILGGFRPGKTLHRICKIDCHFSSLFLSISALPRLSVRAECISTALT